MEKPNRNPIVFYLQLEIENPWYPASSLGQDCVALVKYPNN
jgi:hypothetical protein